ncbi:HPr family phosphocarrier protein [Skermanella stibiiresistens]|jgi:phosphocarrier protein|uniref:HPr family phosphocarrier protein n=1 Tax=Skermanella stibiiresistens TaxID=913326 RepID=UPI0004B453D3|nr:HPr family phosphocarrier protein [Skermanella stibiiresistens]
MPAPGSEVPPGGGAAVVSDTVLIRNQRGLHARAAAKFVKLVALYDAEVEVERNDMVVSGQSIMGLMMLAASQGCTVTLRAQGKQAEPVIAALVDLIGRKFDED